MSEVALLSVGFRLFFWLAAINVVGSIATWLAFLSGVAIGTQGWPAPTLHAHEMIHGTVVPVIAGFLLTAVPNWTGTERRSGAFIVWLVLLWGAGRLALAAGDELPRSLVAIVDVSFLPVLALVLARPILRSRKIRNLPMLLVLLLLASANAAMHGGLVRSDPGLLRVGVTGSVYLVVVLILIIGGRVVPLFTRNALRARGRELAIPGESAVDVVVVVAAIAAFGLDLSLPASRASGLAALVVAPLVLLRQLRWQPLATRDQPILWILHIGHAWIAVGFACLAAASLADLFVGASALHAFTAGAMGTMILGMMTRVSLGHTGRPLVASRVTVTAYVLVVAAAMVRVFGQALAPSHALATWLVSGSAFAGAYLLFAIEFAPILFRPPVQGDPGRSSA